MKCGDIWNLKAGLNAGKHHTMIMDKVSGMKAKMYGNIGSKKC